MHCSLGGRGGTAATETFYMQRALLKFMGEHDSLARAVNSFHTSSLAGMSVVAMSCPGLRAERHKEQGTPLSVTRTLAAEIR